jgi:hypothetical protein
MQKTLPNSEHTMLQNSSQKMWDFILMFAVYCYIVYCKRLLFLRNTTGGNPVLPRGWKYPTKSDGLARPGKCHVCKGVEIVEIYLARLISFNATCCSVIKLGNYALSVEKLDSTSKPLLLPLFKVHKQFQ